MNVALSFCGLCALLLLGKVLRTRITLLQRLYLPSSVIGGLLGLAILTAVGRLIGPGWASDWTVGWGAVPSFLINVVLIIVLNFSKTIKGHNERPDKS